MRNEEWAERNFCVARAKSAPAQKTGARRPEVHLTPEQKLALPRSESPLRDGHPIELLLSSKGNSERADGALHIGPRPCDSGGALQGAAFPAEDQLSIGRFLGAKGAHFAKHF